MALVVIVPAFIIYLFSEALPAAVLGQRAAPILLGVFVFFLTYLLTAIGFLRERTSGTLERVLIAPIRPGELVVGYLLGFGLLGVVQAIILLAAGIHFLGIEFEHGVGPFFAIALIGAAVGFGLGILASLFAESEFQVQQLMPAIIAPQIILGNTFVPVEELPWYLEYPAWAMPVNHLVRGMEYIVLDARRAVEFQLALVVLLAWAVGTAVAATFVVRRAG